MVAVWDVRVVVLMCIVNILESVRWGIIVYLNHHNIVVVDDDDVVV